MIRLRPPSASDTPPGYNGRILHVDLESGAMRVESRDAAFYRAHCGGGLLGVALLLELTPPGRDPYDADSLLIFTSSVVAGHRGVALPRFSVIAKSPLTGGVGESRAEGPWGIALKESGVDAIVISGRAPQPCYLLIDSGEARLCDASAMWGLDTAASCDALCDEHGAETEAAVIGVAGERLVRFAAVVSSRTHPAARMGMGAVMGSKLLKAIALVGGEPVAAADPAALQGITGAFSARMLDNPLDRLQHDPPGFGAWLGGGDLEGYLGVVNFSTSTVPPSPSFDPQHFTALLQWDGDCPGCPDRCIKGIGRPGADARAAGLHQEALAALGPNLGVWELDPLLDLNVRTHLWGLDPVSLGFTLSFLFEAAARADVPLAVRRAVRSGFGDAAAVADLAADIAHRRGPVAWLADGVRRAASRLGPHTARYALHVKGLEMVSFDPRSSAGQALSFAVSPLGPRYDIVEHDIDFDPIGGRQLYVDQGASVGVPGYMDMTALDDEKVRAMHSLMEFWSGLDALDICVFAAAPTRSLSVSDICALVTAITGWETALTDVMGWGRRRLTLMRLYNLREGLTAADDCLPERFFDEPIDAGRHRGAVLERARFEAAKQLHYSLSGWDAGGVP